MSKTAIIIGAGPAGLTVAYELLKRTNIKPIIFEMDDCVGGISRTINYKGNRLDIGGHRFFSKSDRVTRWWQNIMPVQTEMANPEKIDKVMLVRQRLSSVYYLRKFFSYPVSLSWNTIKNLGIFRMSKIGLSYLKIKIAPLKDESNLENFFINRFGQELYRTFFKDYTEKVWGVPCTEISSEWGAQRVKGLSIGKILSQAIKSIFVGDKEIQQKEVETSLITKFLYPKFGPGQMWESVAELVKNDGAKIYLRHRIVGLELLVDKITRIKIKNLNTGEIKEITGDYFFSTMPVKDLIGSLVGLVPEKIKDIAGGLAYRDFITIGLLLKKLKIKKVAKIETKNNLIPDNWIYIQEPDVKLGRVQIFNNWSRFLVAKPESVWLGLEYFVQEGDKLWLKSAEEIKGIAITEMEQIGFIDRAAVIDSVVIKMPKAYPAYFGSYGEFNQIRDFTDKISNLFLIGRNGMHRYNNMDHSVLSALVAVDNIVDNISGRENIWQINADEEYHEHR